MLETARPAVFKSKPQLLAMMPFPTPEMTPAKVSQATQKKGKESNRPPETKTYFILRSRQNG